MKKDKFNIVIISIITILIVLVSIFIYLNNLIEPHMINFTFEGETSKASFVNQKVQITFNRPMQISTDPNSYLRIEPSANYITAWVGNTLNIIFKETLEPNTNYKINISKWFKDTYGNNLANDINLDFTTKKLKFAYITNDPLFEKNKVMKSDVTGEDKEVLFEDKIIKLFSVNDNYLVAVTEKDQLSDIVIKNLKNNTVKKLSLESTKVSGIELSPTNNEFAYISQKATFEDGFINPQSPNQVTIYNIVTGKSTEVTHKNFGLETLSFQYTVDGNGILFKAADGNYYIADLNGDNMISVGKYVATGGFNKDANKIIFVNYDPLSIELVSQFLLEFNSDRSTKMLTNGMSPVLDPMYFNNSDKIIYAEKYKELDTTKGIFKIIVKDNNSKTDILKDDNFSYELPKLSPNDRYLIAEKYSFDDLLNFNNNRDYGFQNKPYTSTLVIYDLQNGKILTSIPFSVNAQWVR